MSSVQHMSIVVVAALLVLVTIDRAEHRLGRTYYLLQSRLLVRFNLTLVAISIVAKLLGGPYVPYGDYQLRFLLFVSIPGGIFSAVLAYLFFFRKPQKIKKLEVTDQVLTVTLEREGPRAMSLHIGPSTSVQILRVAKRLIHWLTRSRFGHIPDAQLLGTGTHDIGHLDMLWTAMIEQIRSVVVQQGQTLIVCWYGFYQRDKLRAGLMSRLQVAFPAVQISFIDGTRITRTAAFMLWAVNGVPVKLGTKLPSPGFAVSPHNEHKEGTCTALRSA